MAEQPNILFLMTDQQRSDSLGCYGLDGRNTPHLDRLAAEGVRFEQCYITNPICTPSRASIFTGKNVASHGVCRLYDNLPDSEVLFPARLRECGYQTALFGKLHVSSIDHEAHHRHPNDGFDVYEPCTEGCLRMDAPYQAYSHWLEERDPVFHQQLKKRGRRIGHVPEEFHYTTWAAERTINFLENRDASKPFCAVMSLFDPHNPYDNYPEDAAALIDRERLPPPHIPAATGPDPEDLERQRRSSYLGDIEDFGPGDLEAMRFGYQVAVAFADRAFGRVLAKLDRLGLRDNTLVIMVSDHGDMLGDHRLVVKGGFFYDAVARVPLIMRWPNRLPAGQLVRSLVSTLDLAATALDAAGVEAERVEACLPESRSLLPVAEGRVGQVRDEVVSVFYNSGLSDEPSSTPYWDPPIHATMIRHRHWKLTLYHGGPQRGWVVEGLLYDMEKDPGETTNLFDVPEHREVRQSLTERSLNWFLQQQVMTGGRGGQTLSQVKLVNSLK